MSVGFHAQDHLEVGVLVLLPAATEPGGEAAYEAYAEAARTSSDAAFFFHTTSTVVYEAAVAAATRLLKKQDLAAYPTGTPVPPAAMMITPHDDRLGFMPDLEASAARAQPAALRAALDTFVTRHVLPLIVPFTEAYEDEIYAGAVTRQLVVIGSKAAMAARRVTLEAVARSCRGEALVVFADVDDDATDGLLAFFDIAQPEASLRYLGFDVATETKYAPDAELATLADEDAKLLATGDSIAQDAPSSRALESALGQFVAAIVGGTASAVRRSEPPPAQNTRR